MECTDHAIDRSKTITEKGDYDDLRLRGGLVLGTGWTQCRQQ